MAPGTPALLHVVLCRVMTVLDVPLVIPYTALKAIPTATLLKMNPLELLNRAAMFDAL
jgi:hypothetical protein